MAIADISVNLPFGLGSFKWKPDEVEKAAAWSLYIELVTRVATQDLAADQGLDKDVLKSLYSLFPATRRILRDAGPKAGVKRGSLGGVAIAVLNRGLRPFLSKWRAAFSAEAPPKSDEFRKELAALSIELTRYAEVLAIIAGVGDQL